MAQYDIVFAINSASSGIAFSEIVLPKSPGGKYALTQNPTTGALGWTAFEPAFTELVIDGANIRNSINTNTFIYIGEDDLVELVSSTASVYGGGMIALISNDIFLRAPAIKLTDNSGRSDGRNNLQLRVWER